MPDHRGSEHLVERLRVVVRIIVGITVVDDLLIAVAQSGVEDGLQQFQVHHVPVGTGVARRAQKRKALRRRQGLAINVRGAGGVLPVNGNLRLAQRHLLAFADRSWKRRTAAVRRCCRGTERARWRLFCSHHWRRRDEEIIDDQLREHVNEVVPQVRRLVAHVVPEREADAGSSHNPCAS